jgi:putative transferase (TIGR04331 family)
LNKKLQLVKDNTNGIPLGQWCLNSFSDNRKTILKDFWKNDRKIEIYKRSYSFYKDFLKEVVPILNSYHKIVQDERYYNTILGKWLFLFSIQINTRIEELKEASKNLGKFKTTLLDKSSYIIPLEYLDLINNIYTDDFNLQLYSQILEKLDIDFEANYIKKASQQKKVFENKISKTKKFENNFWKVLNSIFKPKLIITNGYFFYKPILKKFEIFLKSFGSISHNEMNVEYSLTTEEIDYLFRKYNLKDNSDYEIFKYVVFKNFPLIFLEFFVQVRNLALKEQKVKAIYSSTGITRNYILKFYIAENRENLKVFLHQHGGSFGIDEVVVGEDYETEIADIFYNWGWKNSKNLRPLSHPKLFVPKLKIKKENSVLFVTNIFPKYMHVIKTQANDPDSFINVYTKEQIEVMRRIKRPIFLRKKKYNALFEDDILNSNGINFKRDDFSIPFYKSIQKHRIIFFDHMMTSFLEALSLNVVTIIYIRRDKNLFRKEALPYLELLENARILHYSMDSAVNMLNLENPDSWWNSDEVQEARKEFVHQYARTSKDWAKEWVDEFTKVLEESETKSDEA